MTTFPISSAAKGERGFSLLELALVLIFIGLLAGAGLLLFGKSVQSSARKDTAAHLELQKQSLLIWARHNGALPCSTVATGTVGYAFDTANTSKQFPYVRLGMTPNDAWGNAVRYQPVTSLAHCTDTVATRTANQPGICRALRDWDVNSTAQPRVYTEATGATIRAAAVLVSGGEVDRDGSDGTFDQLAAAGGNYAIAKPTTTYDDLVSAMTAAEVFEAVRSGGYCAYVVTVNNTLSGGTSYVYNRTRLRDVGVVGLGTSAVIKVDIDDVLEVRSAANGGGVILTSAPMTPTTVMANTTINL